RTFVALLGNAAIPPSQPLHIAPVPFVICYHSGHSWNFGRSQRLSALFLHHLSLTRVDHPLESKFPLAPDGCLSTMMMATEVRDHAGLKRYLTQLVQIPSYVTFQSVCSQRSDQLTVPCHHGAAVAYGV
ncbi:unnamed protein product, partial [Ectocarpus sp. 12 AP-2014]